MTRSAASHLDFDPDELITNLDREPFPIRHRLADHPLFELGRLRDLCASMPREHIEYNAAEVPLSQADDPNAVERTGLSPEETIERIEEVPSWIVLKYVDRSPEYGALLEECLGELAPLSETLLPGMGRPESFIFVSSRGAVTPFHIDPEVNFLLQIRGKKSITVFSPSDRGVVSCAQLEGFYAGAHRNLPFPEDHRGGGTTFPLEPGRGVHVPVTAPHWVKVPSVEEGGGVSVSYSITYRTRESTRRAAVFAFNHRLRGLGIVPTPYGRARTRDSVKYQLMRVGGRLRRAVARTQ